MSELPRKPTVSETSITERQAMVRRHGAGESYAAIAADLGCSRRTVIRWVTRAREDAAAVTQYRSRRPRRPHPQTVAPEIVAQIDAIRRAHPGWSARLIRRQVLLDGIARPPAEGTIRRYLRALGHGPVRPVALVPLGWHCQVALAGETSWQVDFKQKGGCGI
jgi:hypothetical protein